MEFYGVLNNIIQDVDNDVGRLCQGREISRPQKKKNLMQFKRRCTIKQKLSDGDYDPWQFLEAISHAIGNSYPYTTLTSRDSEFSDNESVEGPAEENMYCLFITTYYIHLVIHASQARLLYQTQPEDKRFKPIVPNVSLGY